MGSLLKAVLSFVLHALLLVVLPWALIYLAQGSPQIMGMLNQVKSSASIDLLSMATTTMILGFLVSLAALVKGLTDRWSTINLFCEVASTLLQLGIVLLVLGAGDIGSFGVISRTLQAPGPSQPSFTLDMRFVALAFTVLAGLNVVLVFARFYQARSERKKSIGGIIQGLLH